MLAVTTAYKLGWLEKTVAAAEEVFRLMGRVQWGPKDEDLLAHAHVLAALAAGALGREAAGIEYARQARGLYARIAKSDWDGADAAVTAGLATLEEFGPTDAWRGCTDLDPYFCHVRIPGSRRRVGPAAALAP